MARLIVVKAPRGESVAAVVERRRLPGEELDFAELTTVGTELVISYSAAAIHNEAPAEVEPEPEVEVAVEVEHPICSMSAKEAKAMAGELDDAAAAADALAAETDGKGRKSVIAAIEARLAELAE